MPAWSACGSRVGKNGTVLFTAGDHAAANGGARVAMFKLPDCRRWNEIADEAPSEKPMQAAHFGLHRDDAAAFQVPVVVLVIGPHDRNGMPFSGNCRAYHSHKLSNAAPRRRRKFIADENDLH